MLLFYTLFQTLYKGNRNSLIFESLVHPTDVGPGVQTRPLIIVLSSISALECRIIDKTPMHWNLQLISDEAVHAFECAT
jgi:hypothetical protein